MTMVFAGFLINSTNFESTFLEAFHIFGCNWKEHIRMEIAMTLKRVQMEGVKALAWFLIRGMFVGQFEYLSQGEPKKTP